MSRETRKRRSFSPSTRSRSGSRSGGNSWLGLGIVVAIVVIGGLVQWLRQPGPVSAPPPPPVVIRAEGAPADKPEPAVVRPRATPRRWPVAPGGPRENLFGDHEGETIIQTVAASTFLLPYRRRFSDAWIRLSRPREVPNSSNYSGDKLLAVDYEVADAGDAPQALQFVVYSYKDKDGITRPDGILLPSMSLDFPSAVVQGKRSGTAQIRIPFRSSSFGVRNTFPMDAIEVYVVVADSRYQVTLSTTAEGNRRSGPGDARFKASRSVFIGSIPKPHPPRDWRDDEFEFLTGPGGTVTFQF